MIPESIRHRYHHDPTFRMAVDMLQGALERGMLTVDDIGYAAVLAAQLYAERHSAPLMIRIERVDE